jgi:hypothetical protein
MNTRAFASGVAAWLLTATGLFAIPQNFSSGGVFPQQAGMRFEEFAAQKEAWAADDLKGHWSPPKKGEQILKDDAVVFGIAASEIKAERTGEAVKRFRVSFREDAGKRSKASLYERVTQNIRSFTGDSGRADGSDRHTFRHSGGVQIVVLQKSPQEVEVEFLPGS